MRIFLTAILGGLLAGCGNRSTVTQDVGFGERVRVAYSDHNADGFVENDEWLGNGGMEGKLRPVDEVPRPPGRDEPLADLMVRVADVGTEEPMTPVDFRSPAGARVARMEF